MKIIDRYVSGQVFVTALFAVGVLSVVLVLANILTKLLSLLVNQDAPVELLISVIAYILPFSLTFTIPWGFLTAVLLVFGKMSAENELIALRSSGVSIPRLCITVFFLSVGCVGICLWINLIVAPQAQQRMKDALYDIATSNPLAMFGSDRVIDEFPGHKIYVEKNQGTDLLNLLVYKLSDDFVPTEVVHAKHGSLELDKANQLLLLHIYDARFEKRDEEDLDNLAKIRQGITMKESTLPISLKELFEKSKKRRGPSTMMLGELLTRLNEQSTGADHTNFITEINKRFSFSLASLAFALIGIPLAITAHRKETSIGFLLSLLVAIAYFCLIQLADVMRSHPQLHPEILVWSPNVIFLALGGWLFMRLSRR